MREISIEVTPETFEALEVERSLIGFKSRSAYLRWIIDNRAGIDQGTQPDWLVDAYHQRVEALEESNGSTRSDSEGHVTDETGVSGQTQPEDVDASTEKTAAASRTSDGRDLAPGHRQAPEVVTNPDGGSTATPNSPPVTPNDEEATGSDDSTAVTTVRSQDGLELRGTLGKTIVERGPVSASESTTGRDDEDGSDGRDRGQNERMSESADETTSDIDSVNLTPERIERIREDAIAKDAGMLGTVKVDRIDELSRRAVAKTRKQLNRNVETGLEYVSSTELADETIKPGEDVVDLDELSVPGRSAETIERRREAVGRAVAHLRDEGSARRSDFVDALYREFPAGYDTKTGWWRCVKDGLKQVDVVDGGAGSRIWRYDG